MDHDVFISYSSRNADVAEYVLKQLKNASIKCWMAPMSLAGGERYEESIPKAINKCRVLVLIYSEDAGKSCWVGSELTYAYSSYKYIIPFRIDTSDIYDGMKLTLIKFHWIEAHPEYKKKINELIDGIRNILKTSEENRANASISQTAAELNFAQRFEFDDAKDYYKEKRYEEAIDILLAFAISGNRESQLMLCNIYFHISNRSLSPEPLRNLPLRFKEMIEPIAEADADWANFILHCYAYKKNDNEASLKYLKSAIRSEKIGLAFVRLGIVYGYGMGVAVNWSHAMDCYKKAEELGCIEVYSYLAQTYRWGYEKSKPDFSKAFEYYKMGVAQGDWRAIVGLLDFYLYSKNYNGALNYLEELGDDAEGIELLYGEFYRVKFMKEKQQNDFEYAVEFLEIALNKGYSEAYGKLSSTYYSIGNVEKAREYADKGYLLGDSLSYNVLYLIERENKNYSMAWRYTEERNRDFCEGGGYLGQIYIKHNYLPGNVESKEYLPTLLKLLETNASIGGIYSCSSLITLYSEEKFGIKDPEKETKYRRMAAHIAETLRTDDRVKYIYDYAQFLLEKGKPHYNPISAIQYLIRAVELKCVDASKTLLKHIKEKSGSQYYMKQYNKAINHILLARAYDADHELFEMLSKTPVTEDNAASVKEYLMYICENSPQESGEDRQLAAELLSNIQTVTPFES